MYLYTEASVREESHNSCTVSYRVTRLWRPGGEGPIDAKGRRLTLALLSLVAPLYWALLLDQRLRNRAMRSRRRCWRY